MAEQIGVAIVINLETGDYELRFNNVSKPGEGMDYHKVTEALKRVLEDFTKKVDDAGSDSIDGVTKEIH